LTIDDPSPYANLATTGIRLMVKRIIIALLLLPAAEIAAFVFVAALVGVAGALLLMVATTVAGFLVLRRSGRGKIANFRVAVSDAEITATEVNSAGFLTVLAGLLLVLPGFLTDLVGIALLIAPVRQWCGRMALRWFQSWAGGQTRKDPSVIDLSPEEWKQVRERKLSYRPKKPKPH
jgi:UPF0716 protein FxsA